MDRTSQSDTGINSGIKIGSFNCNGLGNPHKRNSVFTWLKKKPEEIFFLQEAHSTPNTEAAWKKAWGGDILFNHGASNSTGVVVLVKPNVNIKIINQVDIILGRVMLLEVEYNSMNYCLVNVYSPNNDDVDFVKTVFLETLGRSRDDYVILVGDWNTVLNNTLDKLGGAANHANYKSQKFLNDMINDYGFSDVLRLCRGDDRVYTHFNKQYKTSSRLDFFLVDDNLVNFPVCTADVSHGYSSDHSYITLNIQGSAISHGKGYWKFNNSFLLNDDFKSGVKNLIRNICNASYDSYSGLWDSIKFQVKDFSIRYGSKRKKERTKRRESIEREINDIKNTPNFITDDILRRKLFDCEIELNALIDKEVQGIMTRARTQWVEEGERSTKYFFGLEKTNGKRKAINKIITPDKKVLFDQHDISNHVVKFYQKLYSSTNPSASGIADYINSSNLTAVDQSVSDDINHNISISELDQIVGKLSNNKSPGWDGLTAEFYKEFWPEIRDTLFNSFQESVNRGTMTPSQRIGILTLIPKPKTPAELCFIGNWRPITLLNVDYKIFTHVIKNRLNITLPYIINKVQAGFQGGKSSCDNLILMSLVLENFNNNPDKEGLLLQVDFEKAFDSVEHTFLFSTLDAMGIGDYLIKLIKVAFQGCMSYANVNGFLSSPVYLMRGLHQGSPLSPILFLLVAQVFSNNLQNSQDITGINIQGVDVLLSLFADDTDIFLEANYQVVVAVLKELKIFGHHSGCKPNIGKTCCVPLGKSKFNIPLLQALHQQGQDFVKKSFTALGITFDNDSNINTIVESNYLSKLDKAKTKADIWSKRDLTLLGRVTIIKSLILSQIVYVAVPLPRPSAQVVKNLNTIIFNFLWGCKRDKIKREVVTRSREEGGLGLFATGDFILSLKLSIINKIFNDSFLHTWKDIIINQFRYPNNPLISIENSLVKRNCMFACDLVKCYKEWKTKAIEKSGGSENLCVWGSRVLTGMWNKPLWNISLINRGILYVSHFLKQLSPFLLLSFDEFLNKWNLAHHEISEREYTMIRWAIKEYVLPLGNPVDINTEIHLSSITNTDNSGAIIRGKKIRELMTSYHSPDDLLPLKEWCKDLNKAQVNWTTVFESLFYQTTNNFKLIQFQYKVLMRISTCRYMRHKMKIEKQSPNCSLCHSSLETLPHLFLHCPHTLIFKSRLNAFISLKLDHHYRDRNNYYFVTCHHANSIVNYVNMVSKWYISKQFQSQNTLDWLGFRRWVKLVIVGEKPPIKSALTKAGLLL